MLHPGGRMGRKRRKKTLVKVFFFWSGGLFFLALVETTKTLKTNKPLCFSLFPYYLFFTFYLDASCFSSSICLPFVLSV